MIDKILKSCDNEFNTKEELIELAKESKYVLMKRLDRIEDNLLIQIEKIANNQNKK